jgi:hypothetical protein
MFLKKLSIQSDRRQVLSELGTVLQAREWGESNQIGLRHRPGATDRWGDAIGSLYNRRDNIKLDAETSFTEWTIEGDWYTRQQIELLQTTLGVQIGRVRFMRLLPKCGLSVHRDDEVRYHLVLKTNPKAYMARASNFVIPQNSAEPVVATCYHMPADGHWWRVDTRETHWVYNGGDEERIHLVVCGV